MFIVCLGSLAVFLSGCTLCPSPYDCDYGLFGGSWERHEPSQGRVGSAFNNAGSATIPSSEQTIETPGEPTPVDSPNRPDIPRPLLPGAQEDI
jgi:hypothetical protein